MKSRYTGNSKSELSYYHHYISWYKSQSELKGTISIKLNALNSISQVSENYDLKLVSNRCIPKLEVSLKLRSPFIDKEYDIKMKKGFQINKIIPPFKGEGSELRKPEPIPPQSIIKDQPKQQQQQSSLQKPQQPQQQPINPNKPKENKPTIINKSQFSSEELKNPDVIDNLNTMEVLSFKEKQLNEKISKIEGRTPKELREQLVKIKCKKKILEDQLGEGALAPDAYIEIIKKQHMHDKALYDYFEQENEKEKGQLISSRLTLLKKEMNDMIEYLKENGK